MRSVLRGAGIVVAACGFAAVLGAGVPLAWVWVASQLAASPGQSVSAAAAFAAIFGPPVTYFALLILAGVIGASRNRGARPPRMTWNHPAGEVRPRNRRLTALEVVVCLGTGLVFLAFEVWLLLFAHTHPPGN